MTGSGTRIAYIEPLDGVRGLSLLAVLAFHSGFEWASGGFLGVSTFFTLSGFLIGSLVLKEWDATGRLDLAAFWVRRVRRLVPASLVTLLALAGSARFWLPGDRLEGLPSDVLAALAYVSNWRFVGEEYAYSLIFSDPSPTQHFWSVAIEGQFYLLFPLLALGALKLGGPRSFAALAVLATVASFAATWFGSGLGVADFRIYYGTDTRATELLIGVLLAAFLRTGLGSRVRTRGGVGLQVVGVASLAAIGGAWCLVALESRLVYEGGLTAYALLSATLLVAAAAPSGLVPALLSLRGLRWVGRVSYAGYLFHWPVFLLVTPERTGLDPTLVLCVRVVCTLLLAELSGRLLEIPIRRGRRFRARAVLGVAGAASSAVLASTVLFVPHAWEDLRRLDPIGMRDAGLFSRDGEERVKIAFFGDSTALTLGLGVSLWFWDHGLAHGVPGAIHLGCGVLDVGEMRSRGIASNPAECSDVLGDWRQRLRAAPRPDLAVVLVGPWEVASRRFSPDGAWLGPGDADFDAALRRALTAAMSIFAEERQRTLWLTSPHLGGESREPATADSHREASEPARIDRLNELIREVAASHRDWIRVVDLAEYMSRRRGGEFDTALRADGVHFTNEGARRISEEWLGRAIMRAYARAER